MCVVCVEVDVNMGSLACLVDVASSGASVRLVIVRVSLRFVSL